MCAFVLCTVACREKSATLDVFSDSNLSRIPYPNRAYRSRGRERERVARAEYFTPRAMNYRAEYIDGGGKGRTQELAGIGDKRASQFARGSEFYDK